MTQGSEIIRETDLAGRTGGYFGVAGSDPRITTLLSIVLPEIQKAASGDPASWQAAFQSVMAKYEGLAKELGLGVSQTQRDLDLLKNANRTDATFASAASRLGIDGLRQYARMQGSGNAIGDERDVGGSARSGTSSAAYTRESPLTMNAAISFAKELGINPIHAAYFEGGSPEMREAIRDAIKSGKVISDEKVKNMHDVSMVVGAIRSGKLKEDDPRVPDTVRKVMKKMRDDGVDPFDAKAMKTYTHDHPEVLEVVRKANAADIAKDANLSNEQKLDAIAATRTAPSSGKPAKASDDKPKQGENRQAANPESGVKTSKLNL